MSATLALARLTPTQSDQAKSNPGNPRTLAVSIFEADPGEPLIWRDEPPLDND